MNLLSLFISLAFLIQQTRNQFCTNSFQVFNLTKYLWDSSGDLLNQSLNSKIINGIRNGNLAPDDYLTYIYHDIIYIKYGVDFIIKLKEKQEKVKSSKYDKVLNLTSQIQGSYNRSYYKMLDLYKMKPKSFEILNKNDTIRAVSGYIGLLNNTLNLYHSIYYYLTTYTCFRLYYWLANYIDQNEIASNNENIYKFWIETNKHGRTWRRIDQFLNENSCVYNKKLALDIFQSSLKQEIALFNLVN